MCCRASDQSLRSISVGCMGMPVDALGIDDYRTRAVEGARRAAAELERRGVEVVITGSLARGRFDLHSDVDFVVLKFPRNLSYAIEGIVEDELWGMPRFLHAVALQFDFALSVIAKATPMASTNTRVPRVVGKRSPMVPWMERGMRVCCGVTRHAMPANVAVCQAQRPSVRKVKLTRPI